MPTSWDQSRFEEAVRILLEKLPAEKLPAAINKKLFFVALRAMALTPKKERIEIARDLSKVVTARRKDGTSKNVPVGFVLAAKQASRLWGEKKMRLGENKKSGRANKLRAWLSLLEKRNRAILGTRAGHAGFLRLGWLSVVRDLGPHVRNKSGAPKADTGGARLRGKLKGRASPARPGWNPTCSIENSAQARSDKRNGLIRIGGPPLDRAFRDELADFIEYLKREGFNEEVERFNAAMG